MRVGPQRVLGDGYDERDPVTQRPTVYEFQGCLWHGCPKCFKNNRHSHSSVHPDRTLHEEYDCTVEKIKTLKDHGYRVIEKWECEWDKDVETDPELQQFLVDFKTPCNLETPSSVEGPTPSSYTTRSTPRKKNRSNTWT